MIIGFDNLDNPEYTSDKIDSPVFKLTTLWGFTLFTSVLEAWEQFPWGVLAQFLASIYGFLLIYFLLQKQLRKPKESPDGTK